MTINYIDPKEKEQRKKYVQNGIENEQEYQKIMKRREDKEKNGKISTVVDNIWNTLQIVGYGGLIIAGSILGINYLKENSMKKNNPQKYELLQKERKITNQQYFEGIKLDSIYHIKQDSLRNAQESELEKILKQEKVKIDSIYKAKADSLKSVYKNQLENMVKK